MAAIQADGLSKRYDGRPVVDEVSFAVEPGEIAGFLGPNGAGKTTTLRMLLGLAAPTAGRSTVLGVPYAQLLNPFAQVGALLDEGGLHPGRTGRSHLRIAARLGGVSAGRVDDVLGAVELGDAADRRIRTYSLGMRRRLALAAALLGDPAVLLLDEPANGLDPGGVTWLRDLLRALASEGRAILVSSHVLGEVAQTVDRVLILADGRLRADSSLAALTADGGLENVFLRLTGGAAPDGTALRARQAPPAGSPGVDALTSAARPVHIDLPSGRDANAPVGLPAPPRPAHRWPPQAAGADAAALTQALRTWPGVTTPALVAVVGPKGGVGRSTITLLLADALAAAARIRVAAVDANPAAGTLGEQAGGIETGRTLPDVLDVAPGLQRAADLAGRALRTSAGAHVYGFCAADLPCALGPEEYAVLLDLLERFYEVVVCDLGASLVDGVGAIVLARATRTVIVSTPDAVTREATHAALSGLEAARVVHVVNQASGAAPTEEPAAATVIVLADPELKRLIDTRTYRYDILHEPARHAALQLAVAVASGLR